MGSKLVDSKHQLNASMNGDKALVSSYCTKGTSDKDIKITALLMMKELRTHYKTIHRTQVHFFDEGDNQHYRQVEVGEAEVALVDSGKPIDNVLSYFGCTKQTLAAPTASQQVSGSASSRPTLRSLAKTTRSNRAASLTGDGPASISFPADWTTGQPDAPNVVAKAAYSNSQGHGSATFYRNQITPGLTLDSAIAAHELLARAQLPGYLKATQRNQSCAGYPAVYLEEAATGLAGNKLVERVLFIQTSSSIYSLVMISMGSNDSADGANFSRISNSIAIRN